MRNPSALRGKEPRTYKMRPSELYSSILRVIANRHLEAPGPKRVTENRNKTKARSTGEKEVPFDKSGQGKARDI